MIHLVSLSHTSIDNVWVLSGLCVCCVHWLRDFLLEHVLRHIEI